MVERIDFGLIDPAAFYKGAANMNSMLQSMAGRQAGQQLASGNRTGAIQTLQRSGDIAGAQQVQKDIWAEDDRLKGIAEKDRVQSLQRTLDAASSLQRVRQNNGDPVAAFDQLLPVFKQNGATDEELAGIRQQLATNPDVFLDGLVGRSKEELKRFNLAPGGQLYDADGKLLADNPMAPVTKVITNGDGSQQIVQIDPRGQPQQQAPAPTNSPPQAPLSQQVGTVLQQAIPGLRITGYGRTPERNAEVGGVENSMHLDDMALDMDPNTDQAAVRAALTKMGITPTEFGIHEGKNGQGRHLHVGWRPKGGVQPAESVATPASGGARVLYSGTPKPNAAGTPKYRTAAEVAALGYPEGTVVQTDAKGVDKVTYKPTGAATRKGGKLPPQEEIALGKMRAQAQGLSDMMGSLDRFEALNKRTDTGGPLALPGVVDIVGAMNPDVKNMQQIAASLMPAMRQGMPGSVSNFDAQQFLAATVGPEKSREANNATIQATRAVARRMSDRTAFYEAYALKNGTIKGAEELWSGYINSYPLFATGLDSNGLIKVRPYKAWRDIIKLEGSEAPQEEQPSLDDIFGEDEE